MQVYATYDEWQRSYRHELLLSNFTYRTVCDANRRKWELMLKLYLGPAGHANAELKDDPTDFSCAQSQTHNIL